MVFVIFNIVFITLMAITTTINNASKRHELHQHQQQQHNINKNIANDCYKKKTNH